MILCLPLIQVIDTTLERDQWPMPNVRRNHFVPRFSPTIEYMIPQHNIQQWMLQGIVWVANLSTLLNLELKYSPSFSPVARCIVNECFLQMQRRWLDVEQVANWLAAPAVWRTHLSRTKVNAALSDEEIEVKPTFKHAPPSLDSIIWTNAVSFRVSAAPFHQLCSLGIDFK